MSASQNYFFNKHYKMYIYRGTRYLTACFPSSRHLVRPQPPAKRCERLFVTLATIVAVSNLSEKWQYSMTRICIYDASTTRALSPLVGEHAGDKNALQGL
jgi:hypothetical protein